MPVENVNDCCKHNSLQLDRQAQLKRRIQQFMLFGNLPFGCRQHLYRHTTTSYQQTIITTVRMKLVIVEPQPAISKKVARIVRLTDPSIEISGVLTNTASLQTLLDENNHPDIVLVSQHCIHPQLFSPQYLQAKLLLPYGKTTIIYYAFRMHTIRQRWLLQHSTHTENNESPLLNLLPDANRSLSRLTTGLQLKNRFLVKQGQRFLPVPVGNIAYFFSDGRWVYLTTFQNSRYAVQYRMAELEQVLDPENFFRINRTYIIAVNSLQQISAYFGGRLKLKLTPDASENVLVSKNRTRGFREWLGE